LIPSWGSGVGASGCFVGWRLRFEGPGMGLLLTI
jgi:hypothetical protein